MTSDDDHGSRPSKAALDARDSAMAHQERAQRELCEAGYAALRKFRAADLAARGETREDRITLVNNHTVKIEADDLMQAIEGARRYPESLQPKTIHELVVKTGDDARKTVRRVHPIAQLLIFAAIGLLVIAWRLGWLDPPKEQLQKSDVAVPAMT